MPLDLTIHIAGVLVGFASVMCITSGLRIIRKANTKRRIDELREEERQVHFQQINKAYRWR